jgi:hypothetical protein
MKNTFLIFLLLALLVCTTAMGGDKYAVATGNWGVTTTWSLTRGGASGATAPTATDTVYIPSPYIVTVDASGKPCYNLIVEAGGALIGNVRNPSSSQVYVRVSGDSVVNNGIIGYDPAKGPDSTTAICFETYTAGKPVTFKGSGNSRISRIRNGSNLSNTTAVIDQNLTLTYTGSSGTGGDGWYGNNGTGTGTTLKVNTGDTLTAVDQCNIGTTSSVDTDGPTTTIQVDGVLKMNGPNSTLHLRPAAGAVVTMIVNGTVEVGRTLKPTGTAAGGNVTSTITVNAGGVLKVGTSGLGVTYFHSPAQTVTGAGSFQFAGGTMHIGAAAGLDPVTGPIRTTGKSFASAAGYTFISATSQATGADFPSTVNFLTVTDTTGALTLTKNLAIDSALTLAVGRLVPGLNSLTVKGLAVSAGAGAFVDGSMIVPVVAAGAKTWTVGQGTESLPLSANFSSVTGGDNVTVAAVSRTVTPPAGGIASMAKVLDRYYRLTKGGLLTALRADSLVLSYAQADVAAQGAAEDSLRAFMYVGTAWSPIAIIRRDTAMNKLVTTSVTSLSDIVITGADMTTAPVLSIKAARAAGAGATVNFEGIATRVKGSYTYMQDTSAGIVLYMASGAYKDSVNSGGIKAGDKIRVQGKISIYNSLYEVVAADLIGFQRLSRSNALPAPVLVTLKEIATNGSAYQAELVKVTGISVTTIDAIYFPARTYVITDKSDSSNAVALRIGNAADTDTDSLNMVKLITFTGPLSQYNSSDPTKGFQLMPILNTDITDNALSVGELRPGLPAAYELGNNYPNPFNPTTVVDYQLPVAGSVRLVVHDMLGREVAVLVNDRKEPGTYSATWDARGLASGVYLYRIQSGNFTQSKKMLLMK